MKSKQVSDPNQVSAFLLTSTLAEGRSVRTSCCSPIIQIISQMRTNIDVIRMTIRMVYPIYVKVRAHTRRYNGRIVKVKAHYRRYWGV